MNLNQITLPVVDLPKAIGFYLKLGFTQIVDSPQYARFMCPDGDSTFSLAVDNSHDTSQTNNRTVIYFEHQKLDELVNQLIDKGIQFEQLPEDLSYLWREATLYDPSGNKIKLFWAGENRKEPPWRVTIKHSEKP